MVPLLAALTLLTAAQADAEFPMKVGSRWTYESNGRPEMIVDVLGTRKVSGMEAVALRIRGGHFLLSQEDIYLRCDKDGLTSYGYMFQGELHEDTPARELLQFPLEKEKSWHCKVFSGVDVTVLGKETLKVPAGTFEAWKVEYEHSDPSVAFEDFRAWFTPGIGFVKFEFWNDYVEKKVQPRKDPMVMTLTRYEATRTIPPATEPELTAEDRVRAQDFLALLESPSVEVRERGVSGLAALGRGVLPLLRKLVGAIREVEKRGRIEQVLLRFPKLEFAVKALEPRGKVGVPLPIAFALRNASTEPVHVLPSLDGSCGKGRYPRYSLEIVDEAGTLQVPASARICDFQNPLEVGEFIELVSGEEMDPLGPGSFNHPMQRWVPKVPGTYRIRAVLETTGAVPEAWLGSAETVPPEILKLLRSIPKGRFESNTLTLVVDR